MERVVIFQSPCSGNSNFLQSQQKQFSSSPRNSNTGVVIVPHTHNDSLLYNTKYSIIFKISTTQYLKHSIEKDKQLHGRKEEYPQSPQTKKGIETSSNEYV
jgi:hypothetical protein